jgi:hypothetical protein
MAQLKNNPTTKIVERAYQGYDTCINAHSALVNNAAPRKPILERAIADKRNPRNTNSSISGAAKIKDRRPYFHQ